MTTYKDAGVDVEAGYEAVKLMKDSVKKTFRDGVMTDLGGFGGLFSLAKYKYEEPVLVSGTDGVGTKLKIAFLLDKHDTIGIDCVAMCVNDIVCSGAEPLFFLDYIALGKNVPKKVAKIVEGISEGCVQAGCALVGGETAEMPGFYPVDEYDVAGFSVGILDKKKVIDGKDIKSGDVLIGLASSGIHSNGYSLVRKVLNPNEQSVKENVISLGHSIGEELLKPTKIYVKPVLEIISRHSIKGISHITGGGFIENIPRMLNEGQGCKIEKGTWPVHSIFDIIQEAGNIEERAMYNTFNMGIGMILCVAKEEADAVMESLKELHESAYVIGEVTNEEGVDIC